MPERTIKIPGPDHPITVKPNPGRIIVTLNGQTIADSRNALTLREASYPAVHYIPRADVDMALLGRTDHASYCPYKGDASYFSMPSGGERLINAVWSYETPYDAVDGIKDHLAFYADRFEITEREA
jgi:uncharacterized protein (DUF427 family)